MYEYFINCAILCLQCVGNIISRHEINITKSVFNKQIDDLQRNFINWRAIASQLQASYSLMYFQRAFKPLSLLPSSLYWILMKIPVLTNLMPSLLNIFYGIYMGLKTPSRNKKRLFQIKPSIEFKMWSSATIDQ